MLRMVHRLLSVTTLLALACAAALVYLLATRPAAASVPLLVFRWAALLVVLGLWIAYLVRGGEKPLSRAQAAALAREILGQSRRLYSGPHELKVVNAAEHADLDQAFYRQTQEGLEREGFRVVGDVVDLTAAACPPTSRTFARCMVGHGDTGGEGIVALFRHVKFGAPVRLLQVVGELPREIQVVDLETEFADGTFVVTSNTREIDTSGAVPGVERRQMAAGTGVAELVRGHRVAVAERAGVQVVTVGTLEEVIAQQHRLQAKINAHKERIGYVDEAELRALLHDRPEAAGLVAEELERIKAEQGARREGAGADRRPD